LPIFSFIAAVHRGSLSPQAPSHSNLPQGFRRHTNFWPSISRAAMSEYAWPGNALVRLEERVRIQEGHCDDFEDFDFEAFAREAWTAWLDDDRNASFKKGFDAASPGARAALVDLCLDPFRRLDGIKSWDFEEPASVYLYLACT
jgi:hypothetical protein